jgi:hypothetical protein
MRRTEAAFSPEALHGTPLDLGDAFIWSEFSTLILG